jgi:hypothetical protein
MFDEPLLLIVRAFSLTFSKIAGLAAAPRGCPTIQFYRVLYGFINLVRLYSFYFSYF